MDRAVVARPPLPESLHAMWLDYVDAWDSGRRRDALAMAEAVTVSLEDLDDVQRKLFGEWLCERLFDDSEGWHGQFGGGLKYLDGGYDRPIDYALSTYPLTSRVVIPYLCAARPQGDGRSLRWLYQCLIGLSCRLPPDSRAQLEAMLESVCGPAAAAIDVLRRAATDDARAKDWLDAAFEDDDS